MVEVGGSKNWSFFVDVINGWPLIKKYVTADYCDLTEKIETNSKALKFKVGDKVKITKNKSIFGKGYTDSR